MTVEGKGFVSKRLFLGINLHSPRHIFEVDKLAFSHVSVCGDATSDGHGGGLHQLAPFKFSTGLSATGQFLKTDLVHKRVDALGRKGGELRPTLFNK